MQGAEQEGRVLVVATAGQAFSPGQLLVWSGDSDGRAGLGLGICWLVLAKVQNIKDSIEDVGEDACSPPQN